jgi:hypothetical protein
MRNFITQYQAAMDDTLRYTTNVRLINSFRIGVEGVNKMIGSLESPSDFLGGFMEVMRSKVPYGITIKAALYNRDERHFVEIEVLDLLDKTPHFYSMEIQDKQISTIKALSDFVI